VLPGRPGRGYFPAAREVNFGQPGRFFPTFSVHDFFGHIFFHSSEYNQNFGGRTAGKTVGRKFQSWVLDENLSGYLFTEHNPSLSTETDTSLIQVLRQLLKLFQTYIEMYHTSDTFGVIKFTLVSALILCLKQPWWSAALAHTITWCMTMPQASVQVSSSHHGRCHLRLVWAQSIWGATATWSHHHHVFFRFHGEPAIARFAMNMYLYLHWRCRNFCHPPTERPPS
jgi:hypothetical protein